MSRVFPSNIYPSLIYPLNYYPVQNPVYIVDQLSVIPAACFSLRKLRGNYSGNAIQVQRSSDNTTSNIGFVPSGNYYVLDTASLLSFCSGTSGYITTWYDQSGNGNNVTQGTLATMPQIVSSGALVTTNGFPAPLFSNNQGLKLASNVGSTTISINAVAQCTSNQQYNIIANIGGNGNGGIGLKVSNGSGGFELTKYGIIDESNATAGNGNLDVFSDLMQSNNTYILYRNSTQIFQTSDTSTPGTPAKGSIGFDYNSSLSHFSGYIPEVVMFAGSLVGSGDQGILETNQKTYY